MRRRRPSRWEMKREVMLAPVGVLDLRLVALRAVGMDEGVEAGEPRVRAVPLLAKLSHRLCRICHAGIPRASAHDCSETTLFLSASFARISSSSSNVTPSSSMSSSIDTPYVSPQCSSSS